MADAGRRGGGSEGRARGEQEGGREREAAVSGMLHFTVGV